MGVGNYIQFPFLGTKEKFLDLKDTNVGIKTLVIGGKSSYATGVMLHA